MANEHEALIEQYRKYQEEVSEYEKKLYAYETQIESYTEDIVKQIKELKSLGVNLDVLKKYADENGDIALTNPAIVRNMIDDVYTLYRETVSEGLSLLENRK